jgi:hypothetical protein
MGQFWTISATQFFCYFSSEFAATCHNCQWRASANASTLSVMTQFTVRHKAMSLSNGSAKEVSSMSYRARVFDAGMILGISCACITGVLWILNEVLKNLMER